MNDFKVGDRVVWSSKFLRSTGQVATNDPMAYRQKGGEIVEIGPEWAGGRRLVTFRDANGDVRKALSCNLVPIGKLELD